MKAVLLSFFLSLSMALTAPSAFSAPKGGKSSEANQLARRGTEEARNQQWDEAIEDLRKATDMERKYEPSLVAALLGRAANYAAQQQFQQAAADYDEVIKLESKNTMAIEGRASIAMKMNDLDKALSMYSEAIKANPKEVKYLEYRAYIYEVKNDLKNALADNEKVLKLQKDNADAIARKQRIEARMAQEKANQFPPLPTSVQSSPQGTP
ncbi:MAG TPA: tetratricopeptide repeat protein [Chthoniobacterales bacterium]|nr:tetratricopeptide repeat protein [Chthoniobacterales bacterium]